MAKEDSKWESLPGGRVRNKETGKEGVIRTIGGRKVFIQDGKSLSEAMIESGKFNKASKTKKGMRESYREEKEKDYKEQEELYNKYKKANEETSNVQEEASKYMNKVVENNKMYEDTYEMRKEKQDRQEAVDKELGKAESLREKYKEEKGIEEPTNDNWRDEIKKNNDQLEKDLEEYKNTHNMAREDEANGYYELFRENERKNAKLKQENPDEKYEYVEAYATYRDKRDKLENVTKDENGNRNYDNMKDATWTGKEYTNDEFLENLEDENWHTERKMLLDAGLTNAQMEFVKNNTTFHNGSPSLDKETTEELIKGAKGEEYRKPDDIIKGRNEQELKDIEKDLDYIAKNGSDDNVKNKYQTFNELKDRYKKLTGKDYDDSNVKIPYDENKTYEYPNGTKINQDLMKERYSGMSAEEIQRDIDFNKNYLMNYKPKDRELHNAEIKEMEKYVDSLPKYKSRISDDFGTKDWEEGYGNQWGESSWKGTKSNSGLYGKDKIKAIDDEIKKAYPGIKTSRKTGRGGLTDSFSYSIMESDEPIIRSIDDFSDAEIDRLYNSGYNRNWYNSKEEYKEALKKDLEKGYLDVNHYNIDNDHRLTPYGKQLFKDIMKVSDAYNYDESASQVDYFNTGHYMSIGVGKDNKPYQVKQKESAKTPKTTNETMNQAIREKANKSTNNKNKSYDVDMSDTTTEEYDKRSKETGFPRSDEHGNYRVEKNGEYEYKMYDKINNPFKAGHESNFYKNLSSEDKKKYNEYIDKGYSQSDIENTLMYKTYDDRLKESQQSTNDNFDEEAYNKRFKNTGVAYVMPHQMQSESTNETMNNAIREKSIKNKYEGTKRWGFGYANDDNIPVYDNKIDYGGDFTHANLSSVSDSELKELYQKQSELYNRAVNSSVGDRRTYNGKKDQLFKDIELLRYGNGVQKAEEEMSKRGIESNNMSDLIRQEANLKNEYRQYKREHPESKMTLNQFKKMNK